MSVAAPEGPDGTGGGAAVEGRRRRDMRTCITLKRALWISVRSWAISASMRVSISLIFRAWTELSSRILPVCGVTVSTAWPWCALTRGQTRVVETG